MVRPTRDLNQTGIDKFFEVLRRLGVRSNELCGKELQLKYVPQVPRRSLQFQLAALKISRHQLLKLSPQKSMLTLRLNRQRPSKKKVVLTSGLSITKGKRLTRDDAARTST